MWGNVVQPDKPHDNIIPRMRCECWVSKATATHSECVTLIAIPLQQWLLERISVLRYTYIACRLVLTTAVNRFVLLFALQNFKLS
jgi:hypothetical protein